MFRVVALPAPSERQKTQMFVQRYIEQFPAAGEIVIFDHSWYNRAGVEHVMDFVDERQHRRFLELCPGIEKIIVDGGIKLDNVGAVAAAGADTFVAGSAIYGSKDYAATIRAMRAAISEACG